MEAASTVLQRASKRDTSPEIRQLCDLVRMAQTTDHNGDEISRNTLTLLSGVLQSSHTKEPLLLRAVAVAHHKAAYALAKRGQHSDARHYWEHSHQLWRAQIRPAPTFWQQFTVEYNKGKQHPLTCPHLELSDRLTRTMAAICLQFMNSLLQGIESEASPPTVGNEALWNTALFYWTETRKLGPSGFLMGTGLIRRNGSRSRF